MKKTIVVILGLLLAFSVAFAQETPEKQPKGGEFATAEPTSYGQGDEEGPMLISGKSNETEKGSINKTGPVMTVNGTQVQAGLYNALQNVENENARAALTRNMERFMEKYRAKLGNYSNMTVEIDEETQEMTVKAKREVKYLGFIKGSATEKIQIEKNGDMKEKKPWYRFMYSERNTEGQTE